MPARRKVGHVEAHGVDLVGHLRSVLGGGGKTGVETLDPEVSDLDRNRARIPAARRDLDHARVERIGAERSSGRGKGRRRVDSQGRDDIDAVELDAEAVDVHQRHEGIDVDVFGIRERNGHAVRLGDLEVRKDAAVGHVFDPGLPSGDAKDGHGGPHRVARSLLVGLGIHLEVARRLAAREMGEVSRLHVLDGGQERSVRIEREEVRLDFLRASAVELDDVPPLAIGAGLAPVVGERAGHTEVGIGVGAVVIGDVDETVAVVVGEVDAGPRSRRLDTGRARYGVALRTRAVGAADRRPELGANSEAFGARRTENESLVDLTVGVVVDAVALFGNAEAGATFVVEIRHPVAVVVFGVFAGFPELHALFVGVSFHGAAQHARAVGFAVEDAVIRALPDSRADAGLPHRESVVDGSVSIVVDAVAYLGGEASGVRNIDAAVAIVVASVRAVARGGQLVDPLDDLVSVVDVLTGQGPGDASRPACGLAFVRRPGFGKYAEPESFVELPVRILISATHGVGVLYIDAVAVRVDPVTGFGGAGMNGGVAVVAVRGRLEAIPVHVHRRRRGGCG